MHSHIAGVRHQVIGRGAGSAMKLHQRLWCLNLGITEMTWTFDPLVARNAYFNFQRLGVSMVEYLEDFYGQMRDGVNSGQASDRMMVSWPLDRPARVATADPGSAFPCLRADEDGEPLLSEVPKETEFVSLDFPSDIEDLRGQDADLASRWRLALRTALTALVADGWVVDTCLKGGTYLLPPPLRHPRRPPLPQLLAGCHSPPRAGRSLATRRRGLAVHRKTGWLPKNACTQAGVGSQPVRRLPRSTGRVGGAVDGSGRRCCRG